MVNSYIELSRYIDDTCQMLYVALKPFRHAIFETSQLAGQGRNTRHRLSYLCAYFSNGSLSVSAIYLKALLSNDQAVNLMHQMVAITADY